MRRNEEELAVEIEQVLEIYRSYLFGERERAVRHYLEQGEPEMAAEGLLIELLESGLARVDWRRMKLLALSARLDQESVFDACIWEKVCEHVDS